MRKLNKSIASGQWITHPDDKSLQFEVRPLNLFNMNNIPTVDNIAPEQVWDWFNYICMNWKGYVDENDKPLVCDEDNKKLVFNFDQEIVGFVIEESNKLRESIVEGKEAKNLLKSVVGELHLKEK